MDQTQFYTQFRKGQEPSSGWRNVGIIFCVSFLYLLVKRIFKVGGVRLKLRVDLLKMNSETAPWLVFTPYVIQVSIPGI